MIFLLIGLVLALFLLSAFVTVQGIALMRAGAVLTGATLFTCGLTVNLWTAFAALNRMLT